MPRVNRWSFPWRRLPCAITTARWRRDAENEFLLAAIACKTSEDAIKSLSPESYEQLLGTVFQVNENGFFSFARRRKNSWTERAMIREMASLAMASAPTLTPSSPASPPRRGLAAPGIGAELEQLTADADAHRRLDAIRMIQFMVAAQGDDKSWQNQYHRLRQMLGD